VNFNNLYDLTIKHFMKIRQIENDAIVSGVSKSEVLEKSDDYARSVVDRVARIIPVTGVS
jgi:hypothetical protein